MKYNRKLNSTEQTMELLNRYQGAWNVVTISCIKGNLKEDTLRQALDIVQLRHPRLRSQIIDRGSLDELCFVESQDVIKIPLQVIFQAKHESWQDIVIQELNYAIDSSKCLMKCFLIFQENIDNHVYLITKIHHAICDGLSTVKLHSEILQNCHAIVSGATIVPVKELPAISPVEQLLPKWMNGISGDINQLLFTLKLQIKQRLYSLPDLTIEQLVPLKNRSCGMVHKCLNSELTQKLVQICRQEKTTVQGALCAAMLFAVMERIKISETNKLNLVCNSYVDLRRRLTPQIEQENLAVIASFLTTFHRINHQTSFWHLARDVYQQNQKGLSQGDIFKPIKLLRKIIEYHLSNCDRVAMSAGVTNMGKIEIPQDYGLFELESINFVAANPIFPGFLLAAVATFQETMFLNFTFSKPSISQQQAENMVNHSISLLTEMCQSQEERKRS